MKEKLTAFIRSFKILRDEEVQLLVDSTNLQSFKKGEILLREGQVAVKCYFILEGCIREYYLKDGLEKSTNFYTEEDPVSAFSSIANQSPSKYYWECVEDCVVTVGNQDLETEMCQKIPRLESIIRDEVERIAGKTQDEFAKFITSSPEDRYKDLLETKPGLLERVPHHQIASYLGITAESLSRIRKRIREKA